jgi:DNA polymerase I-like protein with 3'-5' exonuclease and polymerase domains
MTDYYIDDQEAADDFLAYIKEDGITLKPEKFANNNMYAIASDGNRYIIEHKFGKLISPYIKTKPSVLKVGGGKNSVQHSVKKDYKIALTNKDRASMEAHINEFDVHAFDVETTGLNVRKETVIGFSVCGKEGTSFYYPLYQWLNDTLEPIESNLEKCNHFLMLLKDKKLVTWNGSFDTRITKNDLGVDLISSIYADGMLLKHTLQEDGPFGLKATGVEIQEHIGLNVEEDANKEQIALKANIEKNGGSTTKKNYQMFMADLEVLGIYGCADADLTLRIYHYYLEKLREEGLEEFFFEDEVMPLYKEVTIPMEENGVAINMELLQNTKDEIEEDILALRENVISSLMETEYFADWLTEVATKKFPAKPTGKFVQEIIRQHELDLPELAPHGPIPIRKYSIAKKGVESLPDSLAKSFIQRKELDYSSLNLVDISIKLWKEKEGSLINISSKPQLMSLVFGKMGVKPLSKTEKGTPQFNDTMVEYLADNGHEWASILRNYNRLIKIRGAYVDRFLDGHEDGKFYFSYKQHGTISGRYGSDAQQLPRPMEEGQDAEVVLKYVNRIRKFFISGEDRIFIDSDYESLEPHVFAHVSGDKGLIDIFNKGHDFYSTIAIATEELEGVSADKSADNYLGKVDKQKRQTAKAYALGVPYGMTGFALGKTLDIDTEEAEVLIDNYMESYPQLKSWMDKSKKHAQDFGYISSEAGRIRHLPQVKEIYAVHKDRLLSFKYRARVSKRFGREEIKSKYRDYKNGVNNSRNFQIQSLSASIVNRAAIAINREFKERGINGYCCAQVHDQLILDVPESSKDVCKEIVRDMMENTTKLSLSIKAPPEFGRNWQEAH